MRSSREDDLRLDAFSFWLCRKERLSPIDPSFILDDRVVEHPGTGVRVRAFS
jgi:hypothetical protein